MSREEGNHDRAVRHEYIGILISKDPVAIDHATALILDDTVDKMKLSSSYWSVDEMESVLNCAIEHRIGRKHYRCVTVAY